MSGRLFEIVHEDDELLVVNKPADLDCHPTKGDEHSSLISRVRLHLGQAGAHMINRLDRETTGIVLLALIDIFWFRVTLDLPALLGLALIVGGVLVINLFSQSLGH